MEDRQPTKPNRYAIYDDSHQFLRYEYHERADEPTVVGTPLSMHTLLDNAVAVAMSMDPKTATPSEAILKVFTRVSVITGVYVGTRDEFPRGLEKRVIDLGVKPKAVLIINGHGIIISGNTNPDLFCGLVVDGKPAEYPIDGGKYRTAISVVDNGFEVIDCFDYGTRLRLNDSSYEYHYIAFF